MGRLIEKWGPDLSSYQPDIQWDEVPRDLKLVFRISTKNNTVDKSLDYNLRFTQGKYEIDFYKYGYARDAFGVAQEFNTACNIMATRNVAIGSRVWYDIEGDLVKCPKEQLVELIETARKITQVYHYTFGIYGGLEIVRKLGDKGIYDLWFARYPYAVKSAEIYINKGNFSKLPENYPGEIVGWQYTSIKEVPWYHAPIDYSVWFVNNQATYDIPAYKTDSIAQALYWIGVDNTYPYRTKIAKENGIYDYRGTALQNMQMLELLYSGKLIKI